MHTYIHTYCFLMRTGRSWIIFRHAALRPSYIPGSLVPLGLMAWRVEGFQHFGFARGFVGLHLLRFPGLPGGMVDDFGFATRGRWKPTKNGRKKQTQRAMSESQTASPKSGNPRGKP